MFAVVVPAVETRQTLAHRVLPGCAGLRFPVVVTGTADLAALTFFHVIFGGCEEFSLTFGTLGPLRVITLSLHVLSCIAAIAAFPVFIGVLVRLCAVYPCHFITVVPLCVKCLLTASSFLYTPLLDLLLALQMKAA